MLSNKHLELLNKELDGTLTGDERQQLTDLLARNEEARGTLFDFHELSRALASDSEVEPPASLKSAILRQIESSRNISRAGYVWYTRILEAVFRSLEWKGALLLATGAIAGILIGTLTLGPLLVPGVPTDDVAGTMFTSEKTLPSKPDASIDISLEKITGRIDTYFRHDGNTLDLSLHADTPIEIVLRYPVDSLSAHTLHVPEGVVENIQLQPGVIRYRGGSFNKLALLLRPKAPVPLSVSLEIRSDNAAWTRVIALPAAAYEKKEH